MLLQENLLLLCVNKHGSRVVDVLWRSSDVAKKEEITALLLAHEEQLAADFHGAIVLRNCSVACYWKQRSDVERGAASKQEMAVVSGNKRENSETETMGAAKKRAKKK